MSEPAAIHRNEPVSSKEIVRTEALNKAERRQLKECQEKREGLARLMRESKAMAARLTKENDELPVAIADLFAVLAKRLGYDSHAMVKAAGYDIGIDAKNGTVSLIRREMEP